MAIKFGWKLCHHAYLIFVIFLHSHILRPENLFGNIKKSQQKPHTGEQSLCFIRCSVSSSGQYQTCSSPRGAVNPEMSVRHDPPPLHRSLRRPPLSLQGLLCLLLLSHPGCCLLYPRDSPSRQSKSLDGVRMMSNIQRCYVSETRVTQLNFKLNWIVGQKIQK